MADQSAYDTVNENNRLLAALSYVFGPVGLVLLFSDAARLHPFQRYHAAHGVATNVVLGAAMGGLTLFTAGLGACLVPAAYVPLFYLAYRAFHGEWFTLPVITDFCRELGWLPRR